MRNIYQIFKQYKYKLLFIYLFMLISELSIITQPFLLGKSIDGLIKGTWVWIFLLLISFSFYACYFFLIQFKLFKIKYYYSCVLSFGKYLESYVDSKYIKITNILLI